MRILIKIISLILVTTSAKLQAEKYLQFLYFNAPEDAPKKVVAMFAPGKSVEVKLSQKFFSKTIKLPSKVSKIHFLPNELEVGVKIEEATPFLTIQKSWKKVLVLASHDPTNPVLPIRFTAINADDAYFGEGDIMMINGTSKPIIGYVGKKKLSLKPQKVDIVRKPASKGESYKVLLGQKNEDESTDVLVKRNWRYSSISRQLVFFYRDPQRNRVTYYAAPVYGL